MHSHPFKFSYDKEKYFPNYGLKKNKEFRIFFYSRYVTERRACEIGIIALKKFCISHPNVKVVMAGWYLDNNKIPFPAENYGHLGTVDLSNVIRSCDVGLVFSCTNLSLMPLELMASGVAVISNSGPQTQWMLNKNNSYLVNLDVESILSGLEHLLKSKAIRNKITKFAINFARKTSWEEEVKKVSNFILKQNKIN
jgi:glycosyltransferase involved in cell wall biosynthesis